jgi:hypothetical protein
MSDRIRVTESPYREFEMQEFLIFDILVGQNHAFPVLARKDYPKEVIEGIKSAQIAAYMGFRSLDYVRKRYVSKFHETPTRFFGNEVCDNLLRICEDIEEATLRINHRPESKENRIVADLNFSRLFVTMKSIILLSNYGVFYEAHLLCRFALEQIAWIWKCWISDGDIDFDEISGSRSIADLKNIYESVGQMYGYLSKFAHWKADQHHHFVKTSPQGRIAITMQSAKFKCLSISYACLMLDVALVLGAKMYNVNKDISRDDRRIFSKTRRRVVNQIRQIERRVPSGDLGEFPFKLLKTSGESK